MCIYCNKIVNTDLKEINESYIEDIICETDYMGIYRKFTNWRVLVRVIFVGTWPNAKPIYKPNAIGEIFIKGIS